MNTPAAKARPGKTPPRWQADLALAVVALIWGATFVVVKRALHEISTIYFLTVRFGLASLCLLLLFWRALRRTGRVGVRTGLQGGVAAGVFLWLGYILQTFGLKYTTAGNSGFLTGFYIVLVPLISACFYRRVPKRRESLGILIATAGMALLTIPSLSGGLRINRGDLLTIGCAVAFAVHLLVVGHYSQRERFEAVALGQIVCAALLSAVSLPLQGLRVVWSHEVIFAIALTAVFATALAFALQTWGQQYTAPTRTALIFALEPVFAVATAVLVGGEKLRLAAVVGGGLILTGILAVELKPETRAPHMTSHYQA